MKNSRKIPIDVATAAARQDIARVTKANEIMITAMADTLRETPGITREQVIATLLSSIVRREIDSDDILLMWAVLLMDRAENEVR